MTNVDSVEQTAWRNFDPDAPIAAWGNYLVGQHSGGPGGKPNEPIEDVQRRIAYYYLVATDTDDSLPPETLNFIRGNFIGKLADIRRAHNEDSAARSLDNPSCPPGTLGRIADMGATHPIAELFDEPLVLARQHFQSVIQEAVSRSFAKVKNVDPNAIQETVSRSFAKVKNVDPSAIQEAVSAELAKAINLDLSDIQEVVSTAFVENEDPSAIQEAVSAELAKAINLNKKIAVRDALMQLSVANLDDVVTSFDTYSDELFEIRGRIIADLGSEEELVEKINGILLSKEMPILSPQDKVAVRLMRMDPASSHGETILAAFQKSLTPEEKAAVELNENMALGQRFKRFLARGRTHAQAEGGASATMAALSEATLRQKVIERLAARHFGTEATITPQMIYFEFEAMIRDERETAELASETGETNNIDLSETGIRQRVITKLAADWGRTPKDMEEEFTLLEDNLFIERYNTYYTQKLQAYINKLKTASPEEKAAIEKSMHAGAHNLTLKEILKDINPATESLATDDLRPLRDALWERIKRAKEAQLVRDPATTAAELAAIANAHTEILLLRAISTHPNADADILAIALSKIQPTDIKNFLQTVVNNPNTNANILKAVTANNAADAAVLDTIARHAKANSSLLEAVARNNSASADALSVIVHSDMAIDATLAAVARHINADEAILGAVITHNKANEAALEAAASNNKTSADFLKAIARNDNVTAAALKAIGRHINADADALEAVVDNPSVDVDILTIIAGNPKTEDDTLKMIARRPITTVAILSTIVGHENSDDAVLEAVVRNNKADADILKAIIEHVDATAEVLEAVLRNDNADPDILKVIVAKATAHEDMRLLATVARNNKAEADILTAIVKVIAGRPNADKALTDHVLEAVAHNPDTSEDLLEIIAGLTHNSKVLTAIANNHNINGSLLASFVVSAKANASTLTAVADSKHVNEQTLKIAVHHPNASALVLKKSAKKTQDPVLLDFIVKHDKVNLETLSRVAKNTNVNANTLKTIASHKEVGTSTLAAVALNDKTEAPVLETIVKNTKVDSAVLAAVARHKNVNANSLKAIIKNAKTDAKTRVEAPQRLAAIEADAPSFFSAFGMNKKPKNTTPSPKNKNAPKT